MDYCSLGVLTDVIDLVDRGSQDLEATSDLFKIQAADSRGSVLSSAQDFLSERQKFIE